MKFKVCFILFCTLLLIGCKPFFLKQNAFYNLSYGKVSVLVNTTTWVHFPTALNDSNKATIEEKFSREILESLLKDQISSYLKEKKVNYSFIGFHTDSLAYLIDSLIQTKEYRYFLEYSPDLTFFSRRDSTVEWLVDASSIQILTKKGLILANIERRKRLIGFSDSLFKNTFKSNVSALMAPILSKPFPIKVNRWNPWNWHGASIQYDNIGDHKYEVIIYRDALHIFGLGKSVSFLNNNVTWVQMKPNSYIHFFTSKNNLSVFNAVDTLNFTLKKDQINYFECKYPSSLMNLFIYPDFRTTFIPEFWFEAKQDTVVY